MQKTILLYLVVLTFSFFQSCGNDGPNVDGSLEPYFDRFAAEGEARNVIFDNDVEIIDGNLGEISPLVGEGVLGYYQPPSNRIPRKSIFIDEDFWESASDLEKEYVVFHELGHAFLERMHQTPAQFDSLGRCNSIMAAGDAMCQGLEAYSLARKSGLLDELFAN